MDDQAARPPAAAEVFRWRRVLLPSKECAGGGGRIGLGTGVVRGLAIAAAARAARDEPDAVGITSRSGG